MSELLYHPLGDVPVQFKDGKINVFARGMLIQADGPQWGDFVIPDEYTMNMLCSWLSSRGDGNDINNVKVTPQKAVTIFQYKNSKLELRTNNSSLHPSFDNLDEIVLRPKLVNNCTVELTDELYQGLLCAVYYGSNSDAFHDQIKFTVSDGQIHLGYSAPHVIVHETVEAPEGMLDFTGVFVLSALQRALYLSPNYFSYSTQQDKSHPSPLLFTSNKGINTVLGQTWQGITYH